MIFVSQIVLWWDLSKKIIWGRYLQYSQNKAQIREKKNDFTKIRTTLEPLPIKNNLPQELYLGGGKLLFFSFVGIHLDVTGSDGNGNVF